MSVQRHSRLNQLLRVLPDGYLADTAWLKDLGLSASSIQGYVQRGWLRHVAPRLYQRAGADAEPLVRWEVLLLSLQNIMERPVHAGGQTALELSGYWQYASLGTRRIWLFTDDRRARALLQRAPLDAQVELRTRKLFTEANAGLESRTIDLVTSTLGPAAASGGADGPMRQQLTVSSLERAILEVLSEIPDTVSFSHGQELFEGLTTLRPALMTALLHSCTSIKAKRLFFYFAYQQRGLRNRWRANDFDLGSGKRQIVPGGQYDPQFQITVPRRKRNR